MPRIDLTPALKVTVLKHLLNDRDSGFIAAATGLTPDQVNDVKRDHGYPDKDKMRWAVDILTKKTDEIPPSPHPTPRPAVATPPVTSAPAHPVDRPAATAAAEPLGHTHLLDDAKSSSKARTRNLGAKITTLLEQLATALDEETKAKRAAAAKAREDAEKKQRIAQLEAELAALKGKTTTAKSAPAGDGPDAKTIRAWAADNDVACPAMGRLPTTVRDAYDAAHNGAAV